MADDLGAFFTIADQIEAALRGLNASESLPPAAGVIANAGPSRQNTLAG